jgi:multiple sugar transport system substrate-binding protein
MRGVRRAFVVISATGLVAAAAMAGDYAAVEAEGEEVTLEWWGTSSADTDFQDAVIEAFEAEHPNVHIERSAYPEADYQTKIETAIAAGNPPDLGAVGNLRWMREGLVLPLDDFVREQGIDLSAFNPSIIGDPENVNAEYGCSFGGQLYCLGSYLGAVGVFYNKDMFDAAGIEYPAAWPPMTAEEFVDLACQLRDEENEVWGAAYGNPVEVLPWESEFSADGRTAIVNDPATVEAYAAMARGITEGCAPSLSLFDPWEQGADFFADGQLAMVNTDLQAFKTIEDAGINYGITAPPTVEGVEPFVQTWTDGLGVFAGTEHPEEAMLLTTFLATEGQTIRYEMMGDMPLSQAVAEEVDWAGGAPGREDALEVVAHARPAVFIPNRWDTVGPLYDAYATILDGSKSAQEALDDAVAPMQEELDSAWEVWDEGEG